MQNIVIIDYGSGNIKSAARAFEKVIKDHNLDFQVVISNNPDDLTSASHIVLPGQGAFGDCISNLKSVSGMIEALETAVLSDKKPFLGICVGMQLLANKGFEHGEYDGLGWIDGNIVPIKPTDKALKIPHMGWNTVQWTQKNSPITKNLEKSDPHFYFVHSFMFESKEEDAVIGTTEYGQEVTAIIAKNNILGTQFHPEKSQDAGLTLIHNFLLWKPE